MISRSYSMTLPLRPTAEAGQQSHINATVLYSCPFFHPQSGYFAYKSKSCVSGCCIGRDSRPHSSVSKMLTLSSLFFCKMHYVLYPLLKTEHYPSGTTPGSILSLYIYLYSDYIPKHHSAVLGSSVQLD